MKIKLSLMIAAYLICGYDVVCSAISNVFHGEILDEKFLMTAATFGAFVTDEYFEAAVVMAFYQVGELLSDIAAENSKRSITALAGIRPDSAVIVKNGTEIRVSPEIIKTGDIIKVIPGEKIPVDGQVTKGESRLNKSALTGESIPEKVNEGSAVYSGSVNITSTLYIKAERLFDESTASKIIRLAESSAEKKTVTEKFISRFAKIYTPCIVAAAVFIIAVCPLVFNQPFKIWFYRAMTFLAISCPCALLVSVPMSFVTAMGAASKKGILIKGSVYIDALSNLKTAVFDKTGTLTNGKFSVKKFAAEGIEKQELMKIAAAAEKDSPHPIAEAIRCACTYKNNFIADNTEQIYGMGVKAVISGETVYVGNASLMKKARISIPRTKEDNAIVYTAKNGKYIGKFEVGDTLKNNARETVESLKRLGTEKVIILTGDNAQSGEEICRAVGADLVYSELLPDGKVEILEKLLDNKNGTTAFIGDGINDAPVIARADIGIAMGALGSDAATEAADIVIMNDDISKLADAVKISKTAVRTARENITMTLFVKLAALILGFIGIADMKMAVFADVGILIIAVLNSLKIGILKR